jgi:hypothetical protein
MFENLFFNATQTLIILFLSMLVLIGVVGAIWTRIK